MDNDPKSESPLERIILAKPKRLVGKTTGQIAQWAGFTEFTPATQTAVELVMLRRGWIHQQPKLSSHYPDNRKVWVPPMDQ